jgi:anaerobic magnesium-protoporphyrin IX monomethyl ester cyclase
MATSLLINPSSARTYGASEGGIAFPVVPVLGLASIAGAIRDRGHDARFLDLSYRYYDADLVRRTLLAERPDVVGVTATTPLMNQARDLSYLIKDTLPDAVTVIGGAHPSGLPARTLHESAFDFVAAGEADHTVADLLDSRDPQDIPGLWRRNGDAIIAPRQAGPLLDDLDDLPFPAWDRYPYLDVNRYITRFVAQELPMVVMEFSRGCIYGCDFCASKNTMGRGYRKKSPERCVEELQRLERLGIREVLLVDDIFTTDKNWAAAVCEAILASGVKVKWNAQNGIRVDSAEPELLALMRRAGCYRVYFGFESGNDDVLKAFGKGGRASVEKGIEAVRMARDADLQTNGYFMVGLTGETEESIEDTMAFARAAPLDTMKCGICVPFPGTPMFQRLHREGHIRSYDWDAYTVYNKADAIFEHPTLPWSRIRAAFRRFYVVAILTNPAYWWRRAKYMVRNREILLTIRYASKFWVLIWGKQKAAPENAYAYEDRWRPLDAVAGDELEEIPLPVVRRRGTIRIRRSPDPAPAELA